MNVQEQEQELARRAERIESMGGVRDDKGIYRVDAGWDKNEVVGKDGLVTQANGEVSLWLNGEPAWHKLGTVGEWTNVHDALTAGGLLWKVEKRPLFWSSHYADLVEGSKFTFSRVDSGQQWATVRVDEDGTETQLGTVGNVYEPFQNEAAFDFLQELTKQDGHMFRTAGQLSRGSMVFVSMELGAELVIDPEGVADAVKRYVMFTNRHDGKGKIRVHNTPTRPVCANTVDWAIEGATASWDVLHTPKADQKLQEARATLLLSDAYFKQFEKDATELFETPMSNQEFDQFLAEVAFPLIDEREFMVERVRNNRDQARSLYRDSATNAGITGTRWGAAQALVEQIDHFSDVRVPRSLRLDAGLDKTIQEQMARGAQVVTGTTEKRKSELHKALLTWRR